MTTTPIRVLLVEDDGTTAQIIQIGLQDMDL